MLGDAGAAGGRGGVAGGPRAEAAVESMSSAERKEAASARRRLDAAISAAGGERFVFESFCQSSRCPAPSCSWTPAVCGCSALPPCLPPHVAMNGVFLCGFAGKLVKLAEMPPDELTALSENLMRHLHVQNNMLPTIADQLSGGPCSCRWPAGLLGVVLAAGRAASGVRHRPADGKAAGGPCRGHRCDQGGNLIDEWCGPSLCSHCPSARRKRNYLSLTDLTVSVQTACA